MFPKSCWHSMLLYIWTEIDVSHKLLKLMFPTSSWHCMLLFIETETDVFHKLLTFHVTIYRTEIYVSNKLLKFLVTILMICTAQRQNCPHQLWKMYAWHHSHLLLKNVCLTSFSSLVHTKGVPGLGASPSVLCISLTAVIHVECLGINNVVISLFSCHMKQIYFLLIKCMLINITVVGLHTNS